MIFLDSQRKSLIVDLDTSPASELNAVVVYETQDVKGNMRLRSVEGQTNGTTAVTLVQPPQGGRERSRLVRSIHIHNPNTAAATAADNPTVTLRMDIATAASGTNTPLTIDILNVELPVLHTMVWRDDVLAVWDERGRSLADMDMNRRQRHLSESTSGTMTEVAATSTPGTTIHDPRNDTVHVDWVTLQAINHDTVSRKLTIEWGATTSFDDLITLWVPPEVGLVPVTTELPISGGLEIAAFADTADVISIHGKYGTTALDQ